MIHDVRQHNSFHLCAYLLLHVRAGTVSLPSMVQVRLTELSLSLPAPPEKWKAQCMGVGRYAKEYLPEMEYTEGHLHLQRRRVWKYLPYAQYLLVVISAWATCITVVRFVIRRVFAQRPLTLSPVRDAAIYLTSLLCVLVMSSARTEYVHVVVG